MRGIENPPKPLLSYEVRARDCLQKSVAVSKYGNGGHKSESFMNACLINDSSTYAAQWLVERTSPAINAECINECSTNSTQSKHCPLAQTMKKVVGDYICPASRADERRTDLAKPSASVVYTS